MENIKKFLTSPVVTVGLCGLILFLRKSDALLNPQFWAEDGNIYFKDAYIEGFRSLLSPYPDYLPLIPRLVSCICSFFPIEIVPALYNYAAFGITMLVLCHLNSKRLSELKGQRICCLMAVLVPHSGEVFINITNIQWITALYLASYIFIKPPDKKFKFVE